MFLSQRNPLYFRGTQEVYDEHKQNITEYQYQLIYESATNLVAIMRLRHTSMLLCILY